MTSPFRVGFVPGVTPDKWSRAWADRMPRSRLELVPLLEGDGRDAVAMLRSRELSMALVRLPIERDGVHLIPLYDEQPVVVVSVEHPVAAYDEIDVRDLADEHLLQDPDDVPEWRDVATEVADGSRFPVPPMTVRQAVESVAAEAGVVVLPMSVARAHHRKDVVAVPVIDLTETQVGLAWRVDDEDPRIEQFVGIVRGRTERSSRGTAPVPPPKKKQRR